MPIPLPSTFPHSARFSIYAGLPLSVVDGKCIAWDRPGGREFDQDLFDMLGTTCSEAAFREAVTKWDDIDHRRNSAKSIPIVLPKHFPAGTEFADYEDTPVMESERKATAWDRPGGRPFSGADFFSKATRCSEAKFRELVGAENAANARLQAR